MLKICHLYPDVLNLFGDSGNVQCLIRRLEWRGIEYELTRVPIGKSIDFTQFDLFFMGGGQELEREILLNELRSGVDKEIIAAVEDENVFFCVGGSYQLMGQYGISLEGHQTDYIGALDLHTVDGETRMVGNCMFSRVDDFSGSIVVGFESHTGKTYLGSNTKPLGEVIKGFGNNGEDGTEGARYKNVYCTYSHGPLLAKNPELADCILLAALSRSNPSALLEPLDDELELNAHFYMKNRLGEK